MFENFSLNLLAGGIHRTGTCWNKGSDRLDRCYKCYLPEAGSAQIETCAGAYTICPGRIYFIPGFHLVRQSCRREMLVHWVHFTPESFHLHRRLHRIRGVVAWTLKDMRWLAEDFSRVSEVFENPASARNRLRPDPPLDLVCRLEAILMYLVADLLQNCPEATAEADPAAKERLKPAIDFMDANFRSNPPLAIVARQARMAPNYFHRRFKREMAVTPFDYMESRRLDEARRLLGDARLSVKEVADLTGYENPLHFSRVFRRHFGQPPSAFRKIRMP
jgi:AraC-like DNA-binding protein